MQRDRNCHQIFGGGGQLPLYFKRFAVGSGTQGHSQCAGRLSGCSGNVPDALYYFNSKKQGELDFVIEHEGNVLPIEIKSGKDYTRHNALSGVMANPDYHIPAAVVFHGGNVSVKDKITYYPIYMMMFLREPDLAQDLTYTPDFGALMG